MRNEQNGQGEYDSVTLLIVEDEPILLMDLTLTAEESGATVIQATDVETALSFVTSTPIDTAVLDVNLGAGRTCIAVADKLKGMNVPFVIHSGDLDRQGELINELGAPVFPKPALASQVIASALKLARKPVSIEG